MRICDDYECLRAYVLSPFKPVSRPLGLDLWCKKGSVSWIDVMLSRNQIEPPGIIPAAPTGGVCNSPGLPVSLVNILIEWSETYGRN